MSKKVKKCFAVGLVLCMLLTMLPMMSVSAAAPALDVITDVEHKTIQIKGVVPDLAGQQASIIIMDPSFNGDFSTVFENTDLIVAMDQIEVGADGTFDFSAVLASVETEKGYSLFVNGAAYTTEFIFDEPYTVLAGKQITLPIIVKNCDNFSGLTGAVNYDTNLWRFDSLAEADGFKMQRMDGRFITLTADGMGVDGDAIVGYVLLTAKADLQNDERTTVSFDVFDAAGADLDDALVRIQSLKVDILMPTIPGDVDLNGVVNLKDAILLLQYLSNNTTLSARQIRAANVLAGDSVNTADAVVVMQMCL